MLAGWFGSLSPVASDPTARPDADSRAASRAVIAAKDDAAHRAAARADPDARADPSSPHSLCRHNPGLMPLHPPPPAPPPPSYFQPTRSACILACFANSSSTGATSVDVAATASTHRPCRVNRAPLKAHCSRSPQPRRACLGAACRTAPGGRDLCGSSGKEARVLQLLLQPHGACTCHVTLAGGRCVRFCVLCIPCILYTH